MRTLRYLYEYFLALVIASLALEHLKFDLPAYGVNQRPLCMLANSLIHFPPAVYEKVVLSFALALCIFAALRVLSVWPGTERALLIVGGAIALLGFPLFCLFDPVAGFGLGGALRWENRTPFLAPLLYGEILLIVIAGVLYYRRPLRLSLILNSLIVAAHFCLWALVTGNYNNRLWPDWSWGVLSGLAWSLLPYALPGSGLVASLLWLIYVNKFVQQKTA